MKKDFIIRTIIGFLLFSFVAGCSQSEKSAGMYPEVKQYITASISQFDQIPDDRKNELKKLALYVRTKINSNEQANVTFICTHNSRRSHLSQIWAQAAAAYYNINGVTTYSGGTESTAFNPRAVAAIQRAGLKVMKTTEAENPIYHISFSDDSHPVTGFSKVYNQAPNPKKGFAAVMTCSDADRTCPMVEGSAFRVAVTYVDPKAHDNTDKESAAYDERCRQISREMLYMISQVKGDKI